MIVHVIRGVLGNENREGEENNWNTLWPLIWPLMWVGRFQVPLTEWIGSALLCTIQRELERIIKDAVHQAIQVMLPGEIGDILWLEVEFGIIPVIPSWKVIEWYWDAFIGSSGEDDEFESLLTGAQTIMTNLPTSNPSPSQITWTNYISNAINCLLDLRQKLHLHMLERLNGLEQSNHLLGNFFTMMVIFEGCDPFFEGALSLLKSMEKYTQEERRLQDMLSNLRKMGETERAWRPREASQK
jgi:hypothetical protein